MDISVLFTYGFLLLGVISLWVKIRLFRIIPLWMVFLSWSLIFAIIFNYATFFSLGYTIAFGSAVYLYYRTKSLGYFFLSIVLAFPLYMHLPFTVFNNYKFLDAVKITQNSSPYSLYFNFDKTLIGLFILGFGYSFKKNDIFFLFTKVIKYLFLMIPGIIVITLILGYSKFEPKLPNFTLIWILANLFFACIAEEALFRKLIQGKIESYLSFKNCAIISILVSSLLFGLTHYRGGMSYIALALVAGIFYGHIYHKTKSIEASILLHFAFNLTHFLLFAYPALLVSG
ncbi:MAG: CPBP family intramembrane metalloprotease [Desulfobacteraceae bacterium]|nr:CPBP family intramembrane metalloprotease [Desulfobacteraceae bacterium]